MGVDLWSENRESYHSSDSMRDSVVVKWTMKLHHYDSSHDNEKVISYDL